jgi:hypothetical protein
LRQISVGNLKEFLEIFLTQRIISIPHGKNSEMQQSRADGENYRLVCMQKKEGKPEAQRCKLPYQDTVMNRSNF